MSKLWPSLCRCNTHASEFFLSYIWGFWLFLKLKWILFRCLVWLSNVRNPPKLGYALHPADTALPTYTGNIWIYATTVGEINAIRPFIAELQASFPAKRLVFVSNHEIYADAISNLYPQAVRVFFEQSFHNVGDILDEYPPDILIVAEIPCVLSDAPCRFPFEIPYSAHLRGVPLALVNGWLYGYSPSCKIDALEKWLFGGDYTNMFGAIVVQSSDVKERVIQQGALASKVTVAGNIKWDVFETVEWNLDDSSSSKILACAAMDYEHVVTAGCIADLHDCALVLESFALVKSSLDKSLLVIAPRHPENIGFMDGMMAQLDATGLAYVRRSAISASTDGAAILVLDTFGELRDFYAIADVAFVGRNHNILEPLSFCKPVFIADNWEPTYPSYPVYEHLLGTSLVTQRVEPVALSIAFIAALEHGAAPTEAQVHNAVREVRGGTEVCSAVIAKLLAVAR